MSSSARVIWWGFGCGILLAVYGWLIATRLDDVFVFVLILLDPVNLLFDLLVPEFAQGTIFGERWNVLYYGLHFIVGLVLGTLGSWLYEVGRSRILKTARPVVTPWTVVAIVIIGYVSLATFWFFNPSA